MRSISRASGPASASVRAHTQTTSGMRNMLTTGLVMLLLPADSAFVPRANGHVAFSRSCYSPMLTSASLAGVQLRSYSAHEIVSEFCRPTVESLSLLLRLRGGGAAPTDAANRRATDAPLEKAGRSARNGRSLHQRAIAWLQSKPKQWYARALLFAFYARVPFLSIFSDEWAAVRSADIETKASIAAEIIRRRRRGAKVQKLIGVGYMVVTGSFRGIASTLVGVSSEFCFLRGVALLAPPRICNRGLLAAQTLGVSHTGHHSSRRDAA